MSVSPYNAARRRKRTAAVVREEIVHAAAVTFSRKGFRGTTMQDIAAAAGYSTPTLYSYFRSKAAIYDAILSLTTAASLAALEEPLPEGLTFRQRIELFLRRHLSNIEANREAFAMFFAGRYADIPTARRSASGPITYEEFVARLAAWIRASERCDELRHDPTDLAYVLVGILYSFIRRSMQPGFCGTLTDQAPLLTEIFLKGALESES